MQKASACLTYKRLYTLYVGADIVLLGSIPNLDSTDKRVRRVAKNPARESRSGGGRHRKIIKEEF